MSFSIGTDSFLGMILLRINEIETDKVLAIRNDVNNTYPEIWIDYTRASLFEATNLEPKLFVKSDGKFSRGENTQQFYDSDYIPNRFTSQIPDEIKSKIENTVSRHLVA